MGLSNLSNSQLSELSNSIAEIRSDLGEEPLFVDASLNNQLDSVLASAASNVGNAHSSSGDASDAFSQLRSGLVNTIGSLDDEISDVPTSNSGGYGAYGGYGGYGSSNSSSVPNGWQTTYDRLVDMRSTAQDLLTQLDADIAAGNTSADNFATRANDLENLSDDMGSSANHKKFKNSVEREIDNNIRPALEQVISNATSSLENSQSNSVDTAASQLDSALSLIADNEDALVANVDDSESTDDSSEGSETDDSSSTTGSGSGTTTTSTGNDDSTPAPSPAPAAPAELSASEGDKLHAFLEAKVKARLGGNYESAGARIMAKLEEEGPELADLGFIDFGGLGQNSAGPAAGFQQLAAAAGRGSEMAREADDRGQKVEKAEAQAQAQELAQLGGEKISAAKKPDAERARRALMMKEFSADRMDEIYARSKSQKSEEAQAVLDRVEKLSAKLNSTVEAAKAASEVDLDDFDEDSAVASAASSLKTGMSETQDPAKQLAEGEAALAQASKDFAETKAQLDDALKTASKLAGSRILDEDQVAELEDLKADIATTVEELEGSLKSATEELKSTRKEYAEREDRVATKVERDDDYFEVKDTAVNTTPREEPDIEPADMATAETAYKSTTNQAPPVKPDSTGTTQTTSSVPSGYKTVNPVGSFLDTLVR